MTKIEIFADEMHKVLDIIESAEMSSEDKFATIAMRLLKSDFTPQLAPALLAHIAIMYDITSEQLCRILAEVGGKYIQDRVGSSTELVNKGIKNDN